MPAPPPLLTRRRPFRTMLITLLIAAAGVVSLSVIFGYFLVAPHHRYIGPPPSTLGAHTVRFASTSGSTLAGWYAPGTPGKGAVLLLHGVRGDRWQMLDRAQFLHRAGYGVLLIDFQAHGESTGNRITYGLRESADVRSALAWLAAHAPDEPLAAIGMSMGAAATLLGSAPLPVQALVVEESYTTITRVTTDRMHNYFGPLGRIITPLLLAQLPMRLGVSIDTLRPIEHIATVGTPIYVMCGAIDRDVTLTESRKLFARAIAPKEFWAVPSAGHTDLYAVAPVEYKRRVLGFFAQYLHL